MGYLTVIDNRLHLKIRRRFTQSGAGYQGDFGPVLDPGFDILRGGRGIIVVVAGRLGDIISSISIYFQMVPPHIVQNHRKGQATENMQISLFYDIVMIDFYIAIWNGCPSHWSVIGCAPKLTAP